MVKLNLDDSSRYHRQSLITWWDQSKLLSSKVLVVGAGAIGNEVVKSLALVGVGQIDVCDMDVIENSNLARCVFFRPENNGDFKAKVLAEQAQKINEGVKITGFVSSVQRLGVGFIGKYDLVIGALDNREARAWVNQACRKLNIPWIDGAIEGLRAIVRMFDVSGPCYACTLSEQDYIQMSHRRSCALLAPEEIISGKTPTNATTAAIVAGVQVQEAIKFLVGKKEMLSLVGSCWVYVGDSMTSYITKYQEDPECIAHDTYEKVVSDFLGTSLREYVLEARAVLGEGELAIDFEEDLITLHPCDEHGGTEVNKLRSSLQPGAGRCADCHKDLSGEIRSSISENENLVDYDLELLGLAESDIITVRKGFERTHYIVGAQK